MNAPESFVAVAKRRNITAFDGVALNRGPKAYRVRGLRDALLDTYATDAHLVAYVVQGWEKQFRIKKRAWEKVGLPVTVSVFFADIDTPGHFEWEAPEHAARGAVFVAAVTRAFETHPTLRHAGLYFTKRGCRIVQPIDRPISVGEVEPYIDAWLDELEAAGLHEKDSHHLDRNCRDWTRHFRLPNVVRDGVAYTATMRLDRMAPIAPPSPSAAVSKPKAARRKRPSLGPVRPVNEVPDDWKARVRLLAEAVAREPENWHGLFLYLSGALLEAGLPPERLPAVIAAVSIHTERDTRVDDRVTSALTTLQLAERGEPYGGRAKLEAEWPAVALALERAMRLERDSARPIAETEAVLRDAIANAPDGVTLVSAECGLGKTRALLEVAAERARRTHSSPGAKSARAPRDSKTVISVDKHELALQVVDDLAKLGVAARRLFGPLSLVEPDGSPVCKKHHVALPLVEGGQSMRYELCDGRGIEPCEHASSCRARSAAEGPEDARITVGVHALLPQLVREAGVTGLVGIDEPPPLADAIRFTLSDLETARGEMDAFDGVFAAALTPALGALLTWLRHSPSTEPSDLRGALSAQQWPSREEDLGWARAATQVEGEDLVAFARAAISSEHHRTGPPLTWATVQIAKSSPTAARRIGCASRILHAVHDALVTTSVVKLHAELDGAGAPVAIITRVRESLVRALTREGASIVLDANAALNVPLYASAIGYEPPVHRLAAADGAPIQRTLIRSAQANRKGWLDAHGDLDPMGGSFRKALDASIDWALEDPDATLLAIITMKSVRELLEDSLRPEDDAEVNARYVGRRSLLSDARWLLAPSLRRWRGRLLWGHYGAVRGLNGMMEADALVTLGDPRPNVTQVQNDLALLVIEEPHPRRVEELARAELEQAHGRIRACRRTRSGRALHIGTILPGGTGWGGEVEFRQLTGGPPTQVPRGMHIVKVRAMVDELGGASHAARVLGLSRTTFANYLTGRARIPSDVADRLQDAWRGHTRKIHAK